MHKPDRLSRHSGEEKFGTEICSFDVGQLLKLKNDHVGEEEATEGVVLEDIDVATWEKKNRVWIVPQKYRWEVLYQHHDSQVAGYWGRY